MRRQQTRRELRQFLTHVMSPSYLFEDDEKAIELKDPGDEGETSIDSQVDRYLTDYESEAKTSKTESLYFKRMARKLFEAEDESEDDLGLEDSADEEDGEDAEAKISADDFDVKTFVNSVVRLVENYDSLLEIKNTILRRAEQFLSKNYDDEVISMFKEELNENHGIEIGKTTEDKDEKFQAPPADRAGGTGGGGGGGGL